MHVPGVQCCVRGGVEELWGPVGQGAELRCFICNRQRLKARKVKIYSEGNEVRNIAVAQDLRTLYYWLTLFLVSMNTSASLTEPKSVRSGVPLSDIKTFYFFTKDSIINKMSKFENNFHK
jgi:hypothetical protein